MNIALWGDGFVNWAGGRDFLSLCTQALASRKAELQGLYLILPGLQSVSPMHQQQIRDWLSGLPNCVQLIYSDSRELSHCLQALEVDVVIPAFRSLGRNFPVPWVGFIYDFQHRYYPQFFQQGEQRARDELFGKTLAEAAAVVVHSQAVSRDVQQFYPSADCRVFVLPFALAPLQLGDHPPELRQYNLPDRYFMICNQFWIHKDHGTAFEALALLNSNDTPLHIVCTGAADEYRFPQHYAQLGEMIQSLGIEQQVHILGHIPKEHQLQLLHRATALIQPTLFEGFPGGLAVRDALSLAVPAIVSDLPVNREIAYDGVVFFEPGNAAMLAEKMLAIQCADNARPDPGNLPELVQQSMQQVAEQLLAAVDYAIQRGPRITYSPPAPPKPRKRLVLNWCH